MEWGVLSGLFDFTVLNGDEEAMADLR